MTITDSRPAGIAVTPNGYPPDGANSQQAGVLALSKVGSPAGANRVDRHFNRDAQDQTAVDLQLGQGPGAEPVPAPNAQTLLDPALAFAADVLDDLEKVRTANENRLRQLTRSVEDVDGRMRGFGLDETHPDVARLAAMVESLKRLEHDAELQLGRQMRRHPLHAWSKSAKGVGDKQVARLLAAIGDPYINSSTGLPRTVSALWAYSGLHVLPAGHNAADTQSIGASGSGGDTSQVRRDTQVTPAGVAPKRTRGQMANWSANAKMRAYLIATSCIKQIRKPCTAGSAADAWLAIHGEDCACSAYRVVYDRRRMHTATTHADWSDGHSHNDGLRVASKAILRDLWRAAKEIHESGDPPV